MLENLDITVAEWEDGEDAIDKVLSMHEIGWMFKLIIMDVQMPIKDGWAATRELIFLRDNGTIPELCPIMGHTAFEA